MVLGQNLGQIRPNVVKKRNGHYQYIGIGFFHILRGEYFLKQKEVVVQIPEWKFNANIARNATFEGCSGPNFCLIWVKNDKRLIIFKNFTLASLQVTKLIIINFCLS